MTKVLQNVNENLKRLQTLIWSKFSGKIPIKYFYIYTRCWLLLDLLVQHLTNLIVFLTKFWGPACDSILICCNTFMLVLHMVLLTLLLHLLLYSCWKFVDAWPILQLCCGTSFPILIQILVFLTSLLDICYHLPHNDIIIIRVQQNIHHTIFSDDSWHQVCYFLVMNLLFMFPFQSVIFHLSLLDIYLCCQLFQDELHILPTVSKHFLLDLIVHPPTDYSALSTKLDNLVWYVATFDNHLSLSCSLLILNDPTTSRHEIWG